MGFQEKSSGPFPLQHKQEVGVAEKAGARPQLHTKRSRGEDYSVSSMILGWWPLATQCVVVFQIKYHI